MMMGKDAPQSDPMKVLTGRINKTRASSAIKDAKSKVESTRAKQQASFARGVDEGYSQAMMHMIFVKQVEADQPDPMDELMGGMADPPILQ